MPRYATHFDPNQPRWPEGMPGVGGRWKPRGVPNAFLAMLQFELGGDAPGSGPRSDWGRKIIALTEALGNTNWQGVDATTAVRQFDEIVQANWPHITPGDTDHPSPAQRVVDRAHNARLETERTPVGNNGRSLRALLPDEAHLTAPASLTAPTADPPPFSDMAVLEFLHTDGGGYQTSDVAGQFNVSQRRAGASLRRLQTLGVTTPTIINDNEQFWQANMSPDSFSWSQAQADAVNRGVSTRVRVAPNLDVSQPEPQTPHLLEDGMRVRVEPGDDEWPEGGTGTIDDSDPDIPAGRAQSIYVRRDDTGDSSLILARYIFPAPTSATEPLDSTLHGLGLSRGENGYRADSWLQAVPQHRLELLAAVGGGRLGVTATRGQQRVRGELNIRRELDRLSPLPIRGRLTRRHFQQIAGALAGLPRNDQSLSELPAAVTHLANELRNTDLTGPQQRAVLAAAVRNQTSRVDPQRAAQRVANILATTNPAFNRATFLRAANPARATPSESRIAPPEDVVANGDVMEALSLLGFAAHSAQISDLSDARVAALAQPGMGSLNTRQRIGRDLARAENARRAVHHVRHQGVSEGPTVPATVGEPAPLPETPLRAPASIRRMTVDQISQRLHNTRRPDSTYAQQLRAELERRGNSPAPEELSAVERVRLEEGIRWMSRGGRQDFGNGASIARTTHGTYTVTHPGRPTQRGLTEVADVVTAVRGADVTPQNQQVSTENVPSFGDMTPGTTLRLTDTLSVRRTTHGTYTVRVRGRRARRGQDSQLSLAGLLAHPDVQSHMTPTSGPRESASDIQVGDTITREEGNARGVVTQVSSDVVSVHWTDGPITRSYFSLHSGSPSSIQMRMDRNDSRRFVITPAAPGPADLSAMTTHRASYSEVQVGDHIRMHLVQGAGGDIEGTVTAVGYGGESRIEVSWERSDTASHFWREADLNDRLDNPDSNGGMTITPSQGVTPGQLDLQGGAVPAPASTAEYEAAARRATDSEAPSRATTRSHSALAAHMATGIPNAQVFSTQYYSRIVVDGTTVAYVHGAGRYRYRDYRNPDRPFGRVARVILPHRLPEESYDYARVFQMPESSSRGESRLEFSSEYTPEAIAAINMSIPGTLASPQRRRSGGRGRQIAGPGMPESAAGAVSDTDVQIIPGGTAVGREQLSPVGEHTGMDREFSFEIELRGLDFQEAVDALRDAGLPTRDLAVGDMEAHTASGAHVDDFLNLQVVPDYSTGGPEVKAVPMSGPEGEETLRRIAQVLSDAGGRAGPANTEGTHVHINVREHENDMLLREKVGKSFVNNWDVINTIIDPERHDADMIGSDISRGYHLAAVDWSNDHGTIEFRRLESTLDPDLLQDWVRFLRALTNHTLQHGAIRKRDSLEELLDLLGDKIPADSKERLMQHAEGASGGPVRAPTRTTGSVSRRLRSASTLADSTLQGLTTDDPRYDAAQRELARRGLA